MTSLNKFMEEAAPLPVFTPSTGYSYFPSAPAKSVTQSQSISSREGSTIPNGKHTQALSAGDAPTRASSVLGPSASAAAPDLDPRDSMALEQSFLLMQAHGDEYMDENPLRGEPGNFIFTHTKDRLKARQAEFEAAAAKAREKHAERTSKPATPAAFSTKTKEETPLADGRPLTSKKGSKTEGKKRRKSKAAIMPVSPLTSSPAAGGTPAFP